MQATLYAHLIAFKISSITYLYLYRLFTDIFLPAFTSSLGYKTVFRRTHMLNDSVNSQIVCTAHRISTASAYDNLFDAQLYFWLSMQELMKSGGYVAVRKRMTFVSEELANAISSASLKAIKNMCSAEICTVRPCLSYKTILAMLSTNGKDVIDAKVVLQLLAESNERINTHD
jgi:hypothetical protein